MLLSLYVDDNLAKKLVAPAVGVNTSTLEDRRYDSYLRQKQEIKKINGGRK